MANTQSSSKSSGVGRKGGKIIGAGTGPAGPAMAGPFSAEAET